MINPEDFSFEVVMLPDLTFSRELRWAKEIYRIDPHTSQLCVVPHTTPIDWLAERPVESLSPDGIWELFYNWLDLYLVLFGDSEDAPEADRLVTIKGMARLAHHHDLLDTETQVQKVGAF